MGVNARWICNTCGTICYADGARDHIKLYDRVTASDLTAMITSIEVFDQVIELADESMMRFMRNLRDWLSRHSGHDIQLTNDVALDMLSTEHLKVEEVDGKVREMTLEQEHEEARQNAREANVKQIRKIIKKHATIDGAINEIADMFIYPYGY